MVLECSVCREEEQLGEGGFCSCSAIVADPFILVLALLKYITLQSAIQGYGFRVLLHSHVL